MLEMLELMLDKKILFMLLGGMTIIGVLSKLVVNVVLKRLVHAASNMNRSNHALMRLVRAKFEHACMVSDRVGNVRVFVDKYLYEYKVAGMRLHTWRRLEKAAAGMCFLIGAAGAALEYMLNGMQEAVLRTGATGAVLAILIYLFHLTTDEGYRLEAVQNYMVDYLENVCLHKYEKSPQKELKVMAPEAKAAEIKAAEIEAAEIKDELPIADFGVVSEEEMQKEARQKEKVMAKGVETVSEKMPEEIKELPKTEIPEIQIPEVQIREVQAPKAEAKAPAAPEKPVQEKKDVIIRQILEEFMA